MTTAFLRGQPGVGKTQLYRLLGLSPVVSFMEDYEATRGMTIQKVGSTEIFDADERFLNATPSLCAKAQIIFLCFDPTEPTSLEYVKKLLPSMKKQVSNTCRFVLVATKTDLVKNDDQALKCIAQAKAFAAQNEISYVSTSAKDRAGLERLKKILSNSAKKIAASPVMQKFEKIEAAANREIERLRKPGSWYTITIGQKQKADRIETALLRLKKHVTEYLALSSSTSVPDTSTLLSYRDSNQKESLAMALNSSRYFGFFNRLRGKNTQAQRNVASAIEEKTSLAVSRHSRPRCSNP